MLLEIGESQGSLDAIKRGQARRAHALVEQVE